MMHLHWHRANTAIIGGTRHDYAFLCVFPGRP